MPRQARQKSASGYLHLIARGIGRQVLFEESEDYRRYLSLLERYSGETGVVVCAYCLMENHVHILVRDESGRTPLMMKKLGVSYSAYFNRKYDRHGHLFQDRYKSEAVEDDAYLLTVFRYILQNPKKAGICPVDRYPWSSYQHIKASDTFVDCTLIRGMLGGDRQLVAYIKAENNDTCMEYGGKWDDDLAKEKLCAVLDGQSGTILQSMDRAARNDALRRLKQAGLSVRQIERLTGIGRNIVQRVIE